MKVFGIICWFWVLGSIQIHVKAQTIHEVNPDEFESLLKSSKNVVLIDVRTQDEFEEEHLPGALNIDFYSPDFEIKLKKFARNLPILLYCHSGRRSFQAAKRLSLLGFQEIYTLKGGIEAWKAHNKPVVKK